jgi:homocysteine S-methyltransferase
MNRDTFKQRLATGPLLLDGATGTLLYGKGIAIDQCFDALNCREPQAVAGIHRDYIDAGADVLETNTFASNRFKLAEYGLQNDVLELNTAAVAIARRVIEASFKPILLAGAIGPLGVRLAPLGRVRAPEAEAAFREQIEALVHAEPNGVDLLILETMADLKEVEIAVDVARTVAPHLPIVAEMAFTHDDRTFIGHRPDEAARTLSGFDVDMIGVNCSSGPAQILRLISMMKEVVPDLPIAAVPNAGWPEQTKGGRVMYTATPAYFARYTRAFREVGAGLIGGCCGTTDMHIAAMRQALDAPGENLIPLPRVKLVQRPTAAPTVVDPPTQLAQYLNDGTLVVTVEMSPPKGVGAEPLLQSAHMLKEAGANILNLADSPLARMRMSAWAAAYLVQREVGLETILHFPTRGRNLLRVQGDLLAAHAMGIRNLFVTMGDPTRIGDFPEAMDSYDIVPTGLMQLITQQFNAGVDKSGNRLDQATSFVAGCALNLTPKDVDREMTLLRKKVRNGAAFALTQPVFDAAAARTFVNAYETRYGEPMIPILAGIKLLHNGRNADFLHHEVPGMAIPPAHRQRMHAARDPQQTGVRIAQEIMEEIRPWVQGVYFMSNFGRYDLVADVIGK